MKRKTKLGNEDGRVPGRGRLAGAMAAVALSFISWDGTAFAQTAARPGQAVPDPSGRSSEGVPQPQLVYSPWTKVCDKAAKDEQLCLIIQEARLDTGQFVASAVLVEPEGEARKVLRVTVPLGVQLQPGSRVVIDEGTPVQRPYAICFEIGCISEYEVDADMMGQLKNGQTLVIQAINASGKPISLPMPLAEFVKANDGPPADPKAFEERRKKLQDELRMGEESRNKLGQQPGTTPPMASPAGK